MTEPGQPPGADHASRMPWPRRWNEVRKLTELSLAQPAEARGAFLDRACRDDTKLRAEVEAQVQACEKAAQSKTFLAGSAALFAAPLVTGVTTGEAVASSGTTGVGEAERAMAQAAPQAAQADRRKALELALRTALAGRYEVEHELGRGGAATVYLARDRRHSRSIAIKVFDPPNGATTSAERFQREIRVTAGLMHPHILPLHDSAEAAGLLYYVMPYVDGETLRERLARERPLQLDAALRIVREMASALDCAHRHGVVHRDIKPANVMLCERGGIHDVAKLLDYGLVVTNQVAEEEARLTRSGMVVGTPEFMSPEQCGGDASVSGASDIYSLGAVAYFLLSGQAPFAGRQVMQILAAHLYEAPRPVVEMRPDVPSALADVIARCLEKLPENRFSDIDELHGALAASVLNEAWTTSDARNWWGRHAGGNSAQ